MKARSQCAGTGKVSAGQGSLLAVWSSFLQGKPVVSNRQNIFLWQKRILSLFRNCQEPCALTASIIRTGAVVKETCYKQTVGIQSYKDVIYGSPYKTPIERKRKRSQGDGAQLCLCLALSYLYWSSDSMRAIGLALHLLNMLVKSSRKQMSRQS